LPEIRDLSTSLEMTGSLYLRWRISSVCNAERSSLMRFNRLSAVRFVRTNGNLSDIAARNGPLSRISQPIIETVSKMKRRDFWALAQSPSLPSVSALCSCDHQVEICCGI